jgi:hypothetical protein
MGARRYLQACYVRDIGGVSSAYHRDIPADEIERKFDEAKRAGRAARTAMVSDEAASRGLGTWPSMEAQMPRGWK